MQPPANASPGLRVFHDAAPRRATGASVRSGSGPPRRNARRANASATRRLALRDGMTVRDPGRCHPHAFGAHPRRPTVAGRPRASRVHVVVQNEPDCSDGTESRALTSPHVTAKRIPWQVGDSCLQHATLRFGLFSFSCPRLRCVRPTEAIAGPTTPPRSHSRPLQICKERTMLRAARPRGHLQGGPKGSRTVRKRERFETETPAGTGRWPALRVVALQRAPGRGPTRCVRAPRTIVLPSSRPGLARRGVTLRIA